MKNFIHRTITVDGAKFYDSDGNTHNVSASRMRTSAGFQQITVIIGQQKIELNTDLADMEGAARELARVLLEICENQCVLPEIPA